MLNNLFRREINQEKNKTESLSLRVSITFCISTLKINKQDKIFGVCGVGVYRAEPLAKGKSVNGFSFA